MEDKEMATSSNLFNEIVNDEADHRHEDTEK